MSSHQLEQIHYGKLVQIYSKVGENDELDGIFEWLGNNLCNENNNHMERDNMKQLVAILS